MTSLPLTLVWLTLAYLSSLISSFCSFMSSIHSSLLSVPRHGKLIPVSGPLHLLLLLSWSLFYRTASFSSVMFPLKYYLLRKAFPHCPGKSLLLTPCYPILSIPWNLVPETTFFVYWHMCLPAREYNVNSLRKSFLVLFPAISTVHRTVPGT